MSFDVFLIAFRDGANATADAVAARAVLDRYQYKHCSEFDHYDINFVDDSQVDMFTGGFDGGDKPFDGAMFKLRDFSEAIGEFIFEFSRAAGCVIFPTMKPACVLLPRDDLAAHLPTDLGHEFQRIPVASSAEVLAALKGGFVAWKAYRERVVGRYSAPGEAT